ncbi:MAG: hypothetical protein RR942_14100 [Romboutsia sp.]
MRYYMKSKLFKFKEDFWIKNEYEKDAYFIDKKFISLGLQFDILKDNHLVYRVKEKLLTFMSNYEIFENDNVIARVNQKITFLKDNIKIESKYGEFIIIGDIFGIDYKILKGNKVVATASKELFAFTDNYSVDINFEDEAFMLCLVVIIDNIKDNRKNNQ